MNQKIVLVGPAYPYRGGQALVEAYIFNTLTQLGYDCYTVSYTLLYPSILFPGTTQFDDSRLIPFEHTSRIRRIINSVNPFTWYKAAREIKKLKPDGIIFVWWMPFFGPALGTIARLLKKKTRIIFLVENYISHEKRWFDSFYTKKTLKHADAFISESGFVTEQIKRDFPGTPLHQATLSVYDCYDQKRYTRQTAREFLNIRTKNVVLFFGLIRPYKGLDKLIIAFKELLGTNPDTTLLIVGECYEDKAKYTDLIAGLGIEDKTIFVSEFVANENIEPYFKAADVTVLPYNSGTQSGILMMAYGFKIPVVVTNVGGLAELVTEGQTGYVVNDNSTESLVPAIRRVLDGDAARYEENIRNYTGSVGYVQLGKFIGEVLNS